MRLVAKVIVLGVLLVLFSIALLFILGIVSERKGYREKVVSDIARSTAGSQTLLGPLLAVPYRERIETTSSDGKTRTWQEVEGETVLRPESLVCRAAIQVEERSRGIYHAPVYRATLHLTGAFLVPPRLGLDQVHRLTQASPGTLLLGVSDLRGLRRPPEVRWADQSVEVEPGTRRPWLPTGISAAAGPLLDAEARRIPFSIDLELVGTDHVGMIPVGSSTTVRMESPWPHPAFDGGFLPDQRRVSDQGFQASWQLSRFATGIDGLIDRLRAGGDRTTAGSELMVRFVEPVDVYRQSERAAKYGMLFVLLTFVAFFLFEVLRRLAVHPIQYALAGAALALFFLLLLSLSEYVPFPLAYGIASAACVGLLTFYVGHVLRHFVRGLGFGFALAALYAVLYVLLQSEDYALLIGSVLLFGVLAAIMVMTRRVDWHRVGAETLP